MREILFRGKRFDNGEWMEGSILKVTINGKTAHLIFGDDFAFDGRDVKALSHALIDPSTVGQYTGLTDKNGKKIFEGDILRITERGVTMDGGYVAFENGYPGGWLVKSPTDESKCSLAMRGNVEVIGNIHDNPELLEVSHE